MLSFEFKKFQIAVHTLVIMRFWVITLRSYIFSASSPVLLSVDRTSSKPRIPCLLQQRPVTFLFLFSCCSFIIWLEMPSAIVTTIQKYLTLFQIIFVMLLRFHWSSFIQSLCLSYTTLYKFPFDYTGILCFDNCVMSIMPTSQDYKLRKEEWWFPLLDFNLSIILTRKSGWFC